MDKISREGNQDQWVGIAILYPEVGKSRREGVVKEQSEGGREAWRHLGESVPG